MAHPKIIKSAQDMHAASRDLIKQGKSIGFVPTMGALHAGHRSLIERARRRTTPSWFRFNVNPTQFGAGEDFDKYPRTMDADTKICGEAGTDIIFAPDTLYGKESRTFIQVGELDEPPAACRGPGISARVATVVAKLLNIVTPDRAYFGRKDAQQLLIVETMARDLDLGCKIVPCDIVREPDGLAMSSRNKYLSPAERKQALRSIRRSRIAAIKSITASATR